MTSLEKAQEGLRLAETATPGPFKFEEDQEGSSMGWIMKHNEALFDVRGDSAQQALNAEYFAHCGTHHAEICRWALEVAERLAAIELAAIESAAKAEDFNKLQAENAELKRQLEEARSELKKLSGIVFEAENMALSLDSAGFGRHKGGRMCTPLERYRAYIQP